MEKQDPEKFTLVVDSALSESETSSQNDDPFKKDAKNSDEVLDKKRMARVNDDDDGHFLDVSADWLYEKMMSITLQECYDIVAETVKEHNDDPNISYDSMIKLEMLSKGPEAYSGDAADFELDLRIEAAWINFQSPYPEIRAVTDPQEDTDVPVETLRMYFISLLGRHWITQPSSSFCSIHAANLPNVSFLTGAFRSEALATVSTPVHGRPGNRCFAQQLNIGAARSCFMTYVITLRQPDMFNQSFINFGFKFVMNISFIFLGLGFAGVLRRWVVYKVKAMWPTILPTLALNRALLVPEKRSNINGWSISKYKFFWTVMAISFYIFKALSNFNWITWIAPDNLVLAIICGSSLGLGFNPISTFDWAVVDVSTPLVVPFFSIANRYMGMFLTSFVLIGLYWTNYKWTAYLPINTNAIYDKYGDSFEVSEVVDVNNHFNATAYQNYSPLYISLGNLIATGATFAMTATALTYVFVTEWRQIYESFGALIMSLVKRKANDQNVHRRIDPISQAMAKYPEVPDWWFGLMFAVAFVCGIIGIRAYPTSVPVWMFVVIQAFSLFVLIPSSFIVATTGFTMGFHSLTIILSGYMVPGNGIATLMARAVATSTVEQAEAYLGDLKMGRYAKLPPRALFRAQIIAAIVQTFVTISAIDFLYVAIPDLCSLTQPQRFYCRSPRNFFIDANMFGVIGPDRIFNSLYPELKWCFLIGFVVALVFWIMRRKYTAALRYVHPVLLISGVCQWGENYNLSHYTPGLYNYVLTSGLTAGVAFSALFILLTLHYTRTEFEWWGNLVSSAGVDGAVEDGLLEIPEDGFGLKKGEYW
ncbi:OPT oligopeptide transporter protein-domain-containing protein [Lipomyces tetrasporus]